MNNNDLMIDKIYDLENHEMRCPHVPRFNVLLCFNFFWNHTMTCFSYYKLNAGQYGRNTAKI